MGVTWCDQCQLHFIDFSLFVFVGARRARLLARLGVLYRPPRPSLGLALIYITNEKNNEKTMKYGLDKSLSIH